MTLTCGCHVQEASVFPILNKRVDFSHEQEQHEEIHGFLDSFLAEIRNAQGDTSKFNAAELKRLMQSSKDAMVSLAVTVLLVFLHKYRIYLSCSLRILMRSW